MLIANDAQAVFSTALHTELLMALVAAGVNPHLLAAAVDRAADSAKSALAESGRTDLSADVDTLRGHARQAISKAVEEG